MGEYSQYYEIGQRLKTISQMAGLSEKRIADDMNVSVSIVEKIFNGRILSSDAIKYICSKTGASETYILTGIGNIFITTKKGLEYKHLSKRQEIEEYLVEKDYIVGDDLEKTVSSMLRKYQLSFKNEEDIETFKHRIIMNVNFRRKNRKKKERMRIY